MLDRRVLIVFPGLMLGMLLAALDQTIVATSLPTIVTCSSIAKGPLPAMVAPFSGLSHCTSPCSII